MKIRITSGGIYGASGEVPIGTELELTEVPAGWTGRYEFVGKGASAGSTLITNPADPLGGTIEGLKTHIATLTDPDDVQKLIDAEKAGKNRNGGVALLEARRDELLA